MVDLIWHTRICYLQYASAVFLQPAPAGNQSSLVLVISLPHGTDNISHWQILRMILDVQVQEENIDVTNQDLR